MAKHQTKFYTTLLLFILLVSKRKEFFVRSALFELQRVDNVMNVMSVMSA